MVLHYVWRVFSYPVLTYLECGIRALTHSPTHALTSKFLLLMFFLSLFSPPSPLSQPNYLPHHHLVRALLLSPLSEYEPLGRWNAGGRSRQAGLGALPYPTQPTHPTTKPKPKPFCCGD